MQCNFVSRAVAGRPVSGRRLRLSTGHVIGRGRSDGVHCWRPGRAGGDAERGGRAGPRQAHLAGVLIDSNLAGVLISGTLELGRSFACLYLFACFEPFDK